jgi:hypothetical protein
MTISPFSLENAYISCELTVNGNRPICTRTGCAREARNFESPLVAPGRSQNPDSLTLWLQDIHYDPLCWA